MAERRPKSFTPDEVAEQSFTVARRGFDTDEVETFLAEVADQVRAAMDRERALLQQLAAAERALEAERANRPVLDEDALTTALGAEAASILRSAHEAAGGIKAQAEKERARIIREGRDQATVIRREAEGVLGKREAEAAAEGAKLIEQARIDALAAKAEIEIEAAELAKGNHAKARELGDEALASRERIPGDRARRKRVAQAQIEELKTGRQRLLDAYRVVRTTLDDVTEQLQRADAEARGEAPRAPKVEDPPESPEADDEPADEAVDEPADETAEEEAPEWPVSGVRILGRERQEPMPQVKVEPGVAPVVPTEGVRLIRELPDEPEPVPEPDLQPEPEPAAEVVEEIVEVIEVVEVVEAAVEPDPEPEPAPDPV